ncbi:MAG: hypothetical protein ACKOBW_00510, partial [Planctomycetota bacterium]
AAVKDWKSVVRDDTRDDVDRTTQIVRRTSSPSCSGNGLEVRCTGRRTGRRGSYDARDGADRTTDFQSVVQQQRTGSPLYGYTGLEVYLSAASRFTRFHLNEG